MRTTLRQRRRLLKETDQFSIQLDYEQHIIHHLLKEHKKVQNQKEDAVTAQRVDLERKQGTVVFSVESVYVQHHVSFSITQRSQYSKYFIRKVTLIKIAEIVSRTELFYLSNIFLVHMGEIQMIIIILLLLI